MISRTNCHRLGAPIPALQHSCSKCLDSSVYTCTEKNRRAKKPWRIDLECSPSRALASRICSLVTAPALHQACCTRTVCCAFLDTVAKTSWFWLFLTLLPGHSSAAIQSRLKLVKLVELAGEQTDGTSWLHRMLRWWTADQPAKTS